MIKVPRINIDVARVDRRLTAMRRRTQAIGAKAGHRVTTVTARPRRWMAPVTDVVSAAAWFVGCCSVVSLVAGLVLGWDELVYAGFFLVVLLAISVPFVLGSHHVTAAIDLARSRVVVGERANGRLVVTSIAGHRTLPLGIELPVGRTVATFDLPSLKPGQEHEELFAIPTSRRAVLDLGPVRAVRSDPLSLLRRDQALTDPDVLYVHPRTVRIEESAAGFIRDLEGLTVRKISDNDVAFHALREYVPGDDRRFIHWKSTARTGTLMVRQFEETRRSHLLVTLSTRLEDFADDEEFELAVSVAASLASQALRDDHSVTTLTSSRNLVSEHAIVLLDQLSGVDYEPAAPRLSMTLRRVGGAAGGASVAVIVCGSVTDAAELRRARRYLPPDVRSLVIRAEVGSDVTLRRMGDLDLATIGDLNDLPGVIRRLGA